jgi:signal transduction histidine kinase
VTPFRSLRARFVIGSVLWTVGLLVLAQGLFVLVVRHLPSHMLVVRHWTLLLIFALVFMLGGLLQVGRGLSPINQLRQRLARLREGGSARLDGDYPSEVQPLVTDLNALLDQREQAVARARTKAADLAHGLKTPLAVLAAEAERARAAGAAEFAAVVSQEVTRMQRQVDYHLAQARAAASGPASGAKTPLAESADGLVRTLQRLHAGRPIAIAADIAGDHVVRVQRPDLDEMLGNLLDNACKWARSRVLVTAEIDGRIVRVQVDDDGPGLAEELREQVMQRGVRAGQPDVRADEAARGAGLGLAIVRDLAELYGGGIVLQASPWQGLRATLSLPRA